MKTLREFAQFVGKSNDPITIQSLSFHLFGEGAKASSLRKMIQQFENLPAPFNFDLDVKPLSGPAPIHIDVRSVNLAGIRIGGFLPTKGFRILKDGQAIRVIPHNTGFAHYFEESGSYVIEGTDEGVGSNGYAKVVKTMTVDVKAALPTSPTWRLLLRLSPSELVPSTLRVISAEWKVIVPNPSYQVFNLPGSNAENCFTAEVDLPSLSNSVEVQLKIRCHVQGTFDGVDHDFPHRDFDGSVAPAPLIDWENRDIKVDWVAQYNIAQDPSTGLPKVVVGAFLQGIEPL
jgi:hypothetical protein